MQLSHGAFLALTNHGCIKDSLSIFCFRVPSRFESVLLPGHGAYWVPTVLTNECHMRLYLESKTTN